MRSAALLFEKKLFPFSRFLPCYRRSGCLSNPYRHSGARCPMGFTVFAAAAATAAVVGRRLLLHGGLFSQ